MLASNWLSSDHCEHRGQEEVRKAVDAPNDGLRADHLENAIGWFGRARQIGGAGLWDQVHPIERAARDGIAAD